MVSGDVETNDPRAGTPALLTRSAMDGCRPRTRASDLVDLAAIADVADLPFAADLSCEGLEAVGPSGEEDAVPASAGELTHCRLADPGRCSCDDRYPFVAHRRGTLSV